MNTEDLFKYGVTPKDGEFAGERFKVISVSESGVSVRKWGDTTVGSPRMTFSEGSYKIWHGPKTLFEDHTITATWGSLKKAVEAAGLEDDTRFVVRDFISGLRGAEMKTVLLSVGSGKDKIYIIVE